MEKRPDGTARWNNQYYGSAFPQAFVSLGNQRLSLQLGHFYSIVGYEGVMAPDNFFYSKSYSYQFAGPFTHWGAQLNWRPSQAWTVQAGLHNGWDAFDRTTDRINAIGFQIGIDFVISSLLHDCQLFVRPTVHGDGAYKGNMDTEGAVLHNEENNRNGEVR